MKTAVIMAIIVLADSAGNILLTKGMRQVGEVSTLAPKELLAIAGKIVRNRHFLVSILFMAVHFVGYLAVLSWADLSFVFPATAMVYVISTLAAKFLLGETISSHRWAGTMLVCLGVGLVSLP
jgi:drug/metabolite transporter (DMT)-like permease